MLTCYKWLPLFEEAQAYEAVYTWFTHLRRHKCIVLGFASIAIEMLRKILMLLLVFTLFSCDQSRVSDAGCAEFPNALKDNNTVLEEFARLDESSLNVQDACLFKTSIRKQQDTTSHVYSQIVGECKYTYWHCPLSQFSFTLFSNCNNNDWMYYGFFDVYKMRFFSRDSIASDKTVVKEFDATRINELNVQIGLLKDVETSYDWKEGLTQFILYLYNDKIDEWNHPILKSIESAEIFDFASLSTLTGLSEEDFIFFEMENGGLLAFTYSVERQLISEYLVFTPNQKRYYKSDTIPSELLRACAGN